MKEVQYSPKDILSVQSLEQTSCGSPLSKIIENKISQNGPIDFSEYMQMWLHGADGTPGYYNSNKVKLGYDYKASKSDFATSPEVSPMFGILISKQLIEAYNIMDRPKSFQIVEMGAGYGTLAYDVIHGLREFDEEMSSSVHYVIVENSPTLLKKQKDLLAGLNVSFIQASAVNLPLKDITGVIISNELPDTFPVHLIRKRNDTWEEMFIDKGSEAEFEDFWNEPGEEVVKHLEKYCPQNFIDGVYALNLHGHDWMKRMAESLKRGYVITFDYATCGGPVAVFGAMVNGKQDDRTVFKKEVVGVTDLTASVDMRMLATVGEENGLRTDGYVTEGGFLHGLGFHVGMSDWCSKNGNKVGDSHLIHVWDSHYLLDSNSDVLVQSKGIEGTPHLSGLDYAFHDMVYEGEKERRLPFLITDNIYRSKIDL